jgi:murein DD-endopeptidase MepM/ murein hydrolase activator NlpD
MLALAPAASAHVQDPLQLGFQWPAQGAVTTPFGWTEGRSVRVRQGQFVAVGEPIGVAGCSGWCTGTHLHFELRERGFRWIRDRSCPELQSPGQGG